ncbi:MAG: TPM domain-containing protein [Oscillospiraceae bacterium]|nr:TPM domain-containing protein [Oscillospiraceae bacterium]
MKRKVISLLAILTALTAFILPVSAAGSRLVDDAGLLSGTECAAIERQLDELSAQYGLDIVIVTTDSTGSRTPMEYADDFFDYNGYASDGVLLLVSMEEGDWWISTTGYGITAFTDAGIEYIGKKVVPYLSDGEYAQAFNAFAELCDQFLSQAKTGDPFDTHNLPKEPFKPVRNVIIALVIGLAVAFFATGSMKKKLKSVAQKDQANDYVTPGSLQISQSRDFHLYTHLDRREKAQSGSGSSTHTSSSGTTHGGGGGKF